MQQLNAVLKNLLKLSFYHFYTYYGESKWCLNMKARQHKINENLLMSVDQEKKEAEFS
jgi:hypothetical protein